VSVLINNVSWGPLSVLRSDTNVTGSTFTLGANSASASLMFDAALEGVNWVRCRVTTGPTTNAMTVVIQLGGQGFSPIVTVGGALPAGTAIIGALSANQSVNVAQINATAPTMKAASTAAVATDTSLVVSLNPNTAVTPPTLTKGTQGATGFTVQRLIDAGRVNLIFYATGAATGATTVEAAVTLTKAADTAATSAAASFVITSGKKFRITSVVFGSQGNAVATTQTTLHKLRINTAGAVTTSSTPVVITARTSTPATALAYDRVQVLMPDGIEYTGDGTIQFGHTVNSTFVTNAPVVDCYITGFEY